MSKVVGAVQTRALVKDNFSVITPRVASGEILLVLLTPVQIKNYSPRWLLRYASRFHGNKSKK
jgi:hypothetical protein